MKPIFTKSPPGIRLIIAVTLSIALILFYGKTITMIAVRSVMETAIFGGLYYLANTPRTLLDSVSDNLVDTNRLQFENKALREQLWKKTLIYYCWIN